MSALQTAGQAVTQAASDIGSTMVDTARSAVKDSAKQIAKTPLDILEELLGSSPGKSDATSKEEKAGSQMNQAQIQQKLKQEETFKLEQHQQLHSKLQAQSEAYYKQKDQMEAQQKAIELKQKEQEKFQIKQLERTKARQNLQVQMAQNAAKSEMRVGAG